MGVLRGHNALIQRWRGCIWHRALSVWRSLLLNSVIDACFVNIIVLNRLHWDRVVSTLGILWLLETAKGALGILICEALMLLVLASVWGVFLLLKDLLRDLVGLWDVVHWLNTLLVWQRPIFKFVFLKLARTAAGIDACYRGSRWRGCHILRVLHLWLLLKLMNSLHDDLIKTWALNGFFLGKVGDLMVVVIASKEILSWLTPQRQEILLECIVFYVAPLFVNVLLIKIIFLRRDKWGLKTFMEKVVPRIVPQPWMILNLWSAVWTQTILRLSLDHL